MPSGSKKRAKQKQAGKSSSFKGAEELPSPTSDGATSPKDGNFPSVSASSSADSQPEAQLSNGTVQDTPKEKAEDKHLDPIVEKEQAPPVPEQTPTPAASESLAQAPQAPSPPAAEAPLPSAAEGAEKNTPALQVAEKDIPAVEESQKNAAAAAAAERPEPEAPPPKVVEPVTTQAAPASKAPVTPQAAEPAPPKQTDAKGPEATELTQVEAEAREPQGEGSQQSQSVPADSGAVASTSTAIEASDKNQLMVIPSEPEGVSCSGLMCWLFFPKGARPSAAAPRQRS